MIKNKNIEVEGGELILKNTAGDYVVIPKKQREEVKQMLSEGCNECIDELVSTLPVLDDYAEDGTLVPTSPDNPPVLDKNIENKPLTPKKNKSVETNISTPVVDMPARKATREPSEYLDNLDNLVSDSFTTSKLDSAFVYPLHKRLNDYVGNIKQGGENISEIAQKHINDIMRVTTAPVGDEYWNDDIATYAERSREDTGRKSPKDFDDLMSKRTPVFNDLQKDITNMSNEDLSKILNTDFSTLKGKSMVGKVAAIMKLKPDNISLVEMYKYGKMLNSDDFYEMFGLAIDRSYDLEDNDPEYIAATDLDN